jgi:hypothetical protein
MAPDNRFNRRAPDAEKTALFGEVTGLPTGASVRRREGDFPSSALTGEIEAPTGSPNP